MASEERLRNDLGKAKARIMLVRWNSDVEATKIKKGQRMDDIDRVTSCRGLGNIVAHEAFRSASKTIL